MKLHRRQILNFVVAGCAVNAWPAGAADWPNRPIRLIAGGAGSVTELALERAALFGQFESTGWRQRADGCRCWGHTVLTALREAGATVTVHDPRAVDNARRLFPDLDYAGTAIDAARCLPARRSRCTSPTAPRRRTR